MAHDTYDARATDGTASVELKRLTDAHVSVECEQNSQPCVAGTKPVLSHIRPTDRVGIKNAER